MASSSTRLSIALDRADSPFRRASPPARTATIATIDSYHDGTKLITGVIVKCGSLELLKATYLSPTELAEVQAQVAEFNTDPDTGWARLLSDLAQRRLAMTATELSQTSDLAAIAAKRLPDVTFGHLGMSVRWAEEVARHDVHPGEAIVKELSRSAGRTGVRVTAESGLGKNIVLLNTSVSAEELAAVLAEVEKFNTDPHGALRQLAREVLLEDYRKRAGHISLQAVFQKDAAHLIGRLS